MNSPSVDSNSSKLGIFGYMVATWIAYVVKTNRSNQHGTPQKDRHARHFRAHQPDRWSNRAPDLPPAKATGIHAVFTRRGGNRCAGLLACSDQFSLELRAVDPASAWGAGARIGNLLRHGVHDGLRGHDGACNCSSRVDGLAGRIPLSAKPAQRSPAGRPQGARLAKNLFTR